ncbi:MAG TPA: hypothetical protein VF850_09495 [Gemmatimonadaceae bacterium]
MRRRAVVVILAEVLCAIALGAQGASGPMTMPYSRTTLVPTAYSDSLAEFAARVHPMVEAFRDQSTAVAAGYRRVGMDFPSMGEHWLNTSLLFLNRFDIAKPAMLSYATIEGRPVLTGVVYALLLKPGELPPPVPGGRGMWHDHSGTLDAESALPVHHGAKSDTSAMRFVVLHAWVGIPNPAGLFEADNWALPYARVGVPLPAPVSISAARALSLLSGAKAYYVALAEAEGAARDAVAPALDSGARLAAPIAERMRVSGSSAPADVAALEAAWRTALNSIALVSGTSVAARLNGGTMDASPAHAH